ncbi:MAG: Bro-N domain-containing protein [Ruminococcus sp.]|nr:Bro-N domain-containing protein [Candidatus Apopatosoma intestinale]
MINESGLYSLVLGYSNPRDALSKHVDAEDKGVANCDTLGGAQEMTIINESGLYSLIISSKLPNAKAFKRWVTADILTPCKF